VITDEMSVLKRDFLPEDLLPELRSNEIDGCIAVQADQSEEETLFLLNLATRHTPIKGVVGWIDLCNSTVSERLRYFSQFPKLRGFRRIAQSEPDDSFWLRTDFVRGVSQLADFGFTYDILIYPTTTACCHRVGSAFSHAPVCSRPHSETIDPRRRIRAMG